MNRQLVKCFERILFTALALGLLLGGEPAQAQPAGKPHRIGWLAPAANPGNLDAFRGGLRALGHVEGKSITIEQRYGEGRTKLLDAATGLEQRNLDLIVADGGAAAVALKQAAASTPVVFISGDPVELGLVASLSRPGGTMTGFAVLATELNVKRLELLREASPQALRVGVLYEPRHRERVLPHIEDGARSLGFQVTRLEVRTANDIDEAFATAARERVSVVMPVASAQLHAAKHRLVDLAMKHRLPAVYENRAFVDAGGLMSYGPNLADIFRRAASHADRILTGTKPANLPVELPAKFDLVINLKTARELGLTVPRSLLLQATQVLE